MQNLFSFYTSEIEKYTQKLTKVKTQLFVSSMVRLCVFALASFGIFFLYGNAKWVLSILLLTIIIFLFLVSRHSILQYKRDKLKALIHINTIEILVLKRDFYELPSGKEFKDSLHYFSEDIDLFGRGSFYQYINRTTLGQGSETLAKLLKANTIDSIQKKQEAIQELGEMPKWRQEFSAIASLTKIETSAITIKKWLDNYTAFVPSILKYLPLVFSVVSILVGVTYFLNYVPIFALFSLLILGLLISGLFTKKITKLASVSAKIQSTFQQYNKLLESIENIEFKSVLLQDKKKKLVDSEMKSSAILKEFSKLLAELDQNNNIFYLIFGNGFFLRGLATCYKIEHWIFTHGNSVEAWFDTIAFFDAYNSLGNFAFNHPGNTFPKISNENIILKSSAAGHPLLDPEKSILNDFQINADQFFIITGANMAGKSTFLRTVSLQIMMANVGLPLCAKEVVYNPIKLITSMRTTDSLTDHESYFFSELKRLKFIVDEIQKDCYFIILDEILKGTNSIDKAKGSREFIERLVGSKSTGIIATHDLSLCEVTEEFHQIKNYYFDAEIINNELYFDYKFKKGVCQNMNASFLLKKMQIVE